MGKEFEIIGTLTGKEELMRYTLTYIMGSVGFSTTCTTTWT